MLSPTDPSISVDINSGLTKLHFPVPSQPLVGVQANSKLVVQFNVWVSAHSLAHSTISWQAIASWASLESTTALIPSSLGSLGTLTGPRNYSTTASPSQASIVTQANIVAASWRLLNHSLDSAATFLSSSPVPCPIGTQLRYTLTFTFYRLAYTSRPIDFALSFDPRLLFFTDNADVVLLGAEVDSAWPLAVQSAVSAPGSGLVQVYNLSCVDPSNQTSTVGRTVVLSLSFQVLNNSTLTTLTLLSAINVDSVQYGSASLAAAALSNTQSPQLRITEQIPVGVVFTTDSPSAPIVPSENIDFTVTLTNNALYGRLEQLALVISLDSRLNYVAGSTLQDGAAFVDPLLLSGNTLIWNTTAVAAPTPSNSLTLVFTVQASSSIPLATTFSSQLQVSWASLDQSVLGLTRCYRQHCFAWLTKAINHICSLNSYVVSHLVYPISSI